MSLGGGAVDRSVTEHVRMTPDHLVANRTDDVGKGEISGFAAHLGVEHDLEQQVAELVDQPRHVAAVDGVQDLVSLFDRMRCDRRKTLLEIPRATALGVAQAGHDVDEAIDLTHEYIA